MKKIITFLGTRPMKTEYLHTGTVYIGHVFGEALHKFEDYDEMLVFTTKQAGETTWPVLDALDDPRIRRVDIAIGGNTEELWTLFETLTAEVDPGDQVIFDITHAFRSIPFMVFLAAAYLKEARNVKIEKIYYGAYEMGPPAPVIDISEFITLLDWLTATNQFIYTGNGRYLARLLTQEGDSRASEDLMAAGLQLQRISLAMMLCRPLEVMQHADELSTALERAEKDLMQWARPFDLLADRIEGQYAARALQKPTTSEHLERSLYQQLTLIKWYLGNNQIIQAMTLAREWIVTAVAWKSDMGFPLDWKTRQYQIANKLDDLTQSWPQSERIVSLWNEVREVRNELDHAGMNKRPPSAAGLAKKAQDTIWPAMAELAAEWGIMPTTASP